MTESTKESLFKLLFQSAANLPESLQKQSIIASLSSVHPVLSPCVFEKHLTYFLVQFQ